MRPGLLLATLLALVVAACGPDPADEVETLRVERHDFVISVLAEGELRAAKSTPIMPPSGSTNPRTISWLAPNFSAIKKGDVIARFDISNAEKGALETGIELSKVDIDVIGKQRELERLLAELGNELELVEIEKLMAEQFVVEDSLAYSRYEIIDATRNKKLLEYLSGHLEGKKSNYVEREGAELEVLSALRSTQETQNTEHRQQIDQSLIRAPHDGFLVYEKSWWGQYIDVGSTIFPGNKIASIPNLEKMEAELKVLETEAVGVEPGQKVDLLIDAFPGRPLTGAVSSVSATAAAVDRDSPVKYFTVMVGLDQSDPGWITPDAQVKAEIHIDQAEKTIAIPNQALFRESGNDWVLVRNGRHLEKRKVSLGMRGANRAQVTAGLAAGDEIALYPPDERGS